MANRLTAKTVALPSRERVASAARREPGEGFLRRLPSPGASRPPSPEGRGLNPQDAALERNHHGLRPVVHSQLLMNIHDVCLDGAFTDEQ